MDARFIFPWWRILLTWNVSILSLLERFEPSNTIAVIGELVRNLVLYSVSLLESLRLFQLTSSAAQTHVLYSFVVSPEDVRNVVPILLHGDAAFAGQGVVYETMQLSQVDDFDVGGTIHVIVNNQIGFTTNPIHSRSTPYCSDLGKAFNCPIFHCNGDDPLAVSAALETAVEWRHEWGSDVIIDMVCYRRNGHNELDQPAFTQPHLYKKINRHPPTLNVFEKRLIDEGTLTKEECDEIRQFTLESYENDFEASKTYKTKDTDWLSSRWAGFKGPGQQSRIRPTGVDVDILRRIGVQAGTVPEDFKLHRQMAKIFKARREMSEAGVGIDWGTAEAMAYGSLLLEGNHVRITGQDVQRGTFSHRHAVVKDQNTEEEYTPLNHLATTLDPSSPMEELSSSRYASWIHVP